jgi:hypothetical protein
MKATPTTDNTTIVDLPVRSHCLILICLVRLLLGWPARLHPIRQTSNPFCAWSSIDLWVFTARVRVPPHCPKTSTHDRIETYVVRLASMRPSGLEPPYRDVCREIPIATHSVALSDGTRTWEDHRLIRPHANDKRQLIRACQHNA